MLDSELPVSILNDYFLYGSWRILAETKKYKGINHATLRRYAIGDPVYNEEHRKTLELPQYDYIEKCPTHGTVHCYDCATEKPVPIDAHVIHPNPRPRRVTRAVIYPGTSTEKMLRDLRKIGHRVRMDE